MPVAVTDQLITHVDRTRPKTTSTRGVPKCGTYADFSTVVGPFWSNFILVPCRLKYLPRGWVVQKVRYNMGTKHTRLALKGWVGLKILKVF